MFRAVKPRLAEDLAAAGSVVQRAGQKAITDSEAFWLAQKEEFLKTVSGETNDLLQQGIQQGSQLGLSLNFDLVNQEVLRFSAVYQDAWWNQLASTTRNGLRDALQANIASGAGQRQLVKDITPLFGKDRAKLIASTETTRLYAEGNMIAYRADPTVEKAEWMTVGDGRVCQSICLPLDGESFEKDSAFQYPPAHPACRCWLAPVVEGKTIKEPAMPVAPEAEEWAGPLKLKDSLVKAPLTDTRAATAAAKDTLGWLAESFRRRGLNVAWNGKLGSTSGKRYLGVAHWDGTVALAPRIKRDLLTLYKHMGGAATVEEIEGAKAINGLQVAIHEMVHMVNPARSRLTYRGSGVLLEEGMTEAYSRWITAAAWDAMRAGRGVAQRYIETAHPYDGAVSAITDAAMATGAKLPSEVADTIDRWKKWVPEGERVTRISRELAIISGESEDVIAWKLRSLAWGYEEQLSSFFSELQFRRP